MNEAQVIKADNASNRAQACFSIFPRAATSQSQPPSLLRSLLWVLLKHQTPFPPLFRSFMKRQLQIIFNFCHLPLFILPVFGLTPNMTWVPPDCLEHVAFSWRCVILREQFCGDLVAFGLKVSCENFDSL